MTQKETTIRYTEYPDASGLPESDAHLLREAFKAAGRAYAPYSSYFVGSAVRLKSGTIITGSNQENVAYPSGLCAERVAIFYASSSYPDDPVEAIAITGRADAFPVNTPVMPCGGCRQVLAEYEMKYGHPIRLIIQGERGPVFVIEGMDNLLPMMFKADGLKKS